MTEAERIDAIERQCRQSRLYSETLTNAIMSYLRGNDTLDEVRHEWQQALKRRPYIYPAMLQLSDAPQLDALDLRVLDLCIATNTLHYFLSRMPQERRFDQACDYVLSHGVQHADLMSTLLEIIGRAVDAQGQPTFLGQRLLSYLPEQFDTLLSMAREKQRGHYSYKQWLFPEFIKLLVAAQPAQLDLAWRVALAHEQTLPPTQYYDASLGTCARILLKADPDRFTDWARKIAGPDSPANDQSRALALQALMETDPARHTDLALEATRTPFPTERRYTYAYLQNAGLRALFSYQPEKYWPLLEEAALDKNYYFAAQTIKLLSTASFAQARPTLQRCVAEGAASSAQQALALLLKQPWDGQIDYALTLLAHRSKGIREHSSKWLAAQGQAAVEGISPYLTHRSADARLAAVQTLGKIGGQQAEALLAARLDHEKTLRVKEAVLDAVGVPAARAPFSGNRALVPEAITAEAEATLRYVPNPAPAWFDAEEAPALHWKNGAVVAPAVLRFLLYRQSRVQNKETLSAQVSQALPLLDDAGAGDLALALLRAWANNGAAPGEAWLLPLVGAWGDERLASRLRRQIKHWAEGSSRALAIQGVRALALIDSEITLDELKLLAQEFTRGKFSRAIRQAIASVSGR